MIWLVGSDTQHIVFVDPKGIRNLGGFEHPKLRFHETIKDVERRLARSSGQTAPAVRLHSFILSTTPYENVMWNTHASETKSKQEFEERNVLFMGDGTDYIAKIVSRLES